MVTDLHYLGVAIAFCAAAFAYYLSRFVVEVRMGSWYERLVRDLRRAEARVRDMEAVDRLRPFRPSPPVLN